MAVTKPDMLIDQLISEIDRVPGSVMHGRVTGVMG